MHAVMEAMAALVNEITWHEIDLIYKFDIYFFRIGAL